MIQKRVIISSLITAAILPVSAFMVKAHAEDFAITNNGQGSSSNVTVAAQNQSTSQQSNDANINNNTTNNSNTGNNSANNNTGGDTSVTSGDASNTTNVSTDVNNSSADINNCNCVTNGQASISGNGQDSTNNVNYTSTNSTTINSSNTAHITTITNGNVSTGNNRANNNLGDVNIRSGNINVKESIHTITNSNNVHISSGSVGGFSIDISGNGKGSVNTVTLTQNQNNIVNVSNVADILNLNIWNLITGNNTANDNQGDVNIQSGDINFSLDVQTVANSNTVSVECGCTPPPPPPCTHDCGPVNPPNNPPSNGGGGGGGGSSSNGPGVLAAATGPVLPATGNPWILFAIIGNLLMLFFGAVLRLKSGRSPGFALAI
jgi:hypothetical protein